VVDVPQSSKAAGYGLAAGDAIVAVNGETVVNYTALREQLQQARNAATETVELHVVGATDRKIVVEME
jgi:S1-C subfamily serine protease